MMHKIFLDRRGVLHRMGMVAGSLPVALALGSTAARAALTRKDVNYQLTPHGAQKCGLCASFIAGSDVATGRCKIVDGPIPADGWCPLFAKR
jgi:hypothetical protein